MKLFKRGIILLVSLLLLLLLVAAPVFADPVQDDYALLHSVWKAQTMDGLNNGVWVIPEDAINQYFAAHADNDQVKNPSIKLLGDNKMVVGCDSSIGHVVLTCEINQFVYNQDEAYAEVYVCKKEIAGKPFVSWMLKFVPLGALANLYGNPLKDSNQVKATFSGNTIKINFRPLVEKSLTNPIGKKVEISGITTREGLLELHTNVKAMDVIGFLMQNRNNG